MRLVYLPASTPFILLSSNGSAARSYDSASVVPGESIIRICTHMFVICRLAVLVGITVVDGPKWTIFQ